MFGVEEDGSSESSVILIPLFSRWRRRVNIFFFDKFERGEIRRRVLLEIPENSRYLGQNSSQGRSCSMLRSKVLKIVVLES